MWLVWMPAGLESFSSCTPFTSTVSRLLCPLAVKLHPEDRAIFICLNPQRPWSNEWMVQDGRENGMWNRALEQVPREPAWWV